MNTFHHHLNKVRFAVITLLLLSACKRPEQEIGLGLQPEDDLLSLLQTDTTSLEVFTVKEDSLRTDELSLSLLGNYIDPQFGSTKAGFYTQIRLSSPDVDFGTNAVADSLVLSLVYEGTIYGPRGTQYFAVEELSEDIYSDSSYYSTSRFATFPGNLIVPEDRFQSFNTEDYLTFGEDSVPPQLRVHLNRGLADRFIAAGADVYDSNTNWLEYFKGFHVYSTSAEGGVAYMNLLNGDSKVTLYYHNDSDTLVYEYTINSLSARVNTFEHDYTGVLEPLNNFTPVDGSTEAYVQAGSSVKTKIRFPHLKDFADREGFTINKAQLIIPVSQPGSRFARQSQLYLLTEDEDGDPASLPGQLSTTIDIGGLYDASAGEYRFNITRYVQEYLNGTVSSDFVYLVSGNASVSVTRAILNGPGFNEADPEQNMRLVITYSY